MLGRPVITGILGLACGIVVGVAATARGQSPANPFGTTTVPPQTFSAAPAPGFSPTPQPTLPSGAAPYGATTSPYAAAPAWDPYATPGSLGGPFGTPPPALSPYGQPAPPSTIGYPFSDWGNPLGPTTRLIQNVSIRNTWIFGNGDNDFGIDDVDLSASLAFPFFHHVNIAPVLFTPGFSFHFLNGPDADPDRDLPGTVYDAFGQLSWRPQFTPRFGADLAVSFGVYSDFSYVNRSSFRILGGLGLLTFNPQWQGALGVVYLDRLETKILPAGGLIWTPHDDARFELLFPQPKISQRITTYGNAQIWGYIAGEYGGGQWSIAHASGNRDEINYNDLRLILGVETFGHRNWRGLFEVGYVFNREIIYRSGAPAFKPDDTFLLRAGLGF